MSQAAILCNIKKLLMMQIWGNDEKPAFRPNFFLVYFTSTSSYILLQAIILCNLTEN